MRRILFINPFGIGDVLFTTPLVAAVKRALPDARLGFVCNRRVLPVLAHNKDLDWVWVFERDEFRDLWNRSKGRFVKKAWEFHKEISTNKFDTAFDLSLSNQFGFWLWSMGVGSRIGFRYRGRGKFLNKTILLQAYEGKHVAEYQLELLHCLVNATRIQASLCAPRLYYQGPDEAAGRARDILRQMALEQNGGPMVGIAPGGGDSWGMSAMNKRWSPGHYAALCGLLGAQGYRLFFFGGAMDGAVVDQIQSAMPSRLPSLAGSCDLETTAALMKHCRFIVTNDGGLLHLAVAQDIPTASFFGPTDDTVYGPFPRSVKHLVLARDLGCRPCYKNFRMPPCPFDKECLEGLSPQHAFQKIQDWQMVLHRSA